MSKVLVDRDRVVESMCRTWRHDFGLDKLEGCDFCSGMTDKEREHLRRQMGKLFDRHLAPALSAVTAERDRLESMLIRTATRHFALQIKDRADDKKLDECLSEGIAMLEAERDQYRAEVERYVPLHEAIQRAAGELPEGWEIQLCIERDGGGVELIGPDGTEDFATNNERLDYTVIDALEAAIAAKEA